MAAKKTTALTTEERLEKALVPIDEQPYEIPENWCWVRFKDLSIIRTGKKDANYGSEDGQYPFFTCASEPIRCDGYSFDCSAILLAGNGDINNISRFDGKFEAYQRTYVVEVKTPNLTDYSFHFFKYRWFDYNKDKMFGSAIPYIRLGNLQDFPTPLAPLAEQKRIVDTITELFADLDKAAENAQTIIDSCDSRTASILYQAFTGRLIGMNCYTTIPLENIAETIRIGPFGSALHKEDYICGGIPVINPKHIKNQKIAPEEMVTVSAIKASELSSYRLRANDIVIARRGDMGRSAPVSQKEEGWLCGTGSMIIRLKNGYDGAFYSQIIASKACVDYLEENCVGSTLKNLNEKIIRQLPIPNFTQEQQQEIVRILDELLAYEQRIKEAAEEMLDKIAMMKKSILADAFRGKLGTNDPSDQPATELLKQILA